MWFPLPFEVIWKHHMGERQWTVFDLVSHTIVIYLAVITISIFCFPDMAVPSINHPDHRMERQMYALEGFILVIWILGIANLWEIRKRKKSGIVLHTYYRGVPRFLPNTSLYKCLIIPFGSGLVAYGFYRFGGPALGIYLFGMALSQLAHASDGGLQRETEKLDRRDREIELENKIARIENDQHGSWDVVRIAKPSQKPRRPEEIEQFEARWKKVLKATDSPDSAF
jgi:hypothetical protein